jgi:hypothetical protein
MGAVRQLRAEWAGTHRIRSSSSPLAEHGELDITAPKAVSASRSVLGGVRASALALALALALAGTQGQPK